METRRLSWTALSSTTQLERAGIPVGLQRPFHIYRSDLESRRVTPDNQPQSVDLEISGRRTGVRAWAGSLRLISALLLLLIGSAGIFAGLLVLFVSPTGRYISLRTTLVILAASAVAIGLGRYLHERKAKRLTRAKVKVWDSGFEIRSGRGRAIQRDWMEFARIRIGEDFILFATGDGGYFELSASNGPSHPSWRRLSDEFRSAARGAGLQVME